VDGDGVVEHVGLRQGAGGQGGDGQGGGRKLGGLGVAEAGGVPAGDRLLRDRREVGLGQRGRARVWTLAVLGEQGDRAGAGGEGGTARDRGDAIGPERAIGAAGVL